MQDHSLVDEGLPAVSPRRARAVVPRPVKPRLQTVIVGVAVVVALLLCGLTAMVGGAFLNIVRVAEEARTTIVPRLNKQQEYAVFAAQMSRLAEIILNTRDPARRDAALEEAELLAGRFAADVDLEILAKLDQAVHAVRRSAHRADVIDALQANIDAQRAKADQLFTEVLKIGAVITAGGDDPAGIQMPFFRLLKMFERATTETDRLRLEELGRNFLTQIDQHRAVIGQLAPDRGGTEAARVLKGFEGLHRIFILCRDRLANLGDMAQETVGAHNRLKALSDSLAADAASSAWKIAETIVSLSNQGMSVGAMGLGATTVILAILSLLLRRHVIQPIMRASDALTRVQEELRPIALPPARLAELDAITTSVERFGQALVETHEYAQALRQGEERLRSILTASPFPIVIARIADGSVMFYNVRAEALFGTAGPAITLTRSDRFFAVPGDRHRLVELIDKADRARDIELPLCSALGHPFWALLSVVRITYGDEAMVFAAVNDITVLKHSEAEMRAAKEAAEQALSELQETQKNLIQAEKLASLGTLVAGVAHEVNTPVGTALTGITHLADQTRATIQVFETGKLRKSDLQTYLALANEACGLVEANLNRASELIQSFKQVAVDQASAERRCFNLKTYIDEVLVSLNPRLKKTRHHVTVSCPANLAMDSYPGALSQVLTNLVMNSLLHAFAEGDAGQMSITVSQPTASEVELCYADDGCGIPEKNLAKIFDPFFTTKRGSGGSGLGLHIVYNLVTTTLKGQIDVTSLPGIGTTFILRFPAIAPTGTDE